MVLAPPSCQFGDGGPTSLAPHRLGVLVDPQVRVIQTHGLQATVRLGPCGGKLLLQRLPPFPPV